MTALDALGQGADAAVRAVPYRFPAPSRIELFGEPPSEPPVKLYSTVCCPAGSILYTTPPPALPYHAVPYTLPLSLYRATAGAAEEQRRKGTMAPSQTE